MWNYSHFARALLLDTLFDFEPGNKNGAKSAYVNSSLVCVLGHSCANLKSNIKWYN